MAALMAARLRLAARRAPGTIEFSETVPLPRFLQVAVVSGVGIGGRIEQESSDHRERGDGCRNRLGGDCRNRRAGPRRSSGSPGNGDRSFAAQWRMSRLAGNIRTGFRLVLSAI
jgi:hypothetical protein